MRQDVEYILKSQLLIDICNNLTFSTNVKVCVPIPYSATIVTSWRQFLLFLTGKKLLVSCILFVSDCRDRETSSAS
jgi:hypothetical protein